MINVKRLLGLVMAISMLSTSVFANTGNVRTLVRDYQIKVRVENVDNATALKDLTKELVKSNINQKDLMDYVRSTSTPEDFEQFLAIVENGSEEMDSFDQINAGEFQHILGQVFSNTHINMGANYNAGNGGTCTSRYFGYVAVVASVYLAIVYIQRRTDGEFMGGIDLPFGDSLTDRQLILTTAITGALGIYLTTSCKAK